MSSEQNLPARASIGWFGLDWENLPLINGNVEGENPRIRPYAGSSHWRHAFAWARQFTNDVRMDFGGAFRVQLGTYRDEHIVLPTTALFAAVDAAARAFLVLSNSYPRYNFDVAQVLSSPSGPGRVSVKAEEPDRLAGIWGALMGNYRVMYGAGETRLQAEFGGVPGIQVSFEKVDSARDTARQEFIVEDLEESTDLLLGLGCQLADERKNQLMFTDPEQNLLTIIQLQYSS